MRYEDASQSGTSSNENPVARDDSDALAAGARGPATGNVINGADTQSGSLGADLAADGARIVSISGAQGSDTSFAGGKLSVGGEFGRLTIDAQGNYSYLANKDAPESSRDVFTYKLAAANGQSDSAALTIEIGKSPAVVQANAQRVIVGPDGVVVLPAGVELSDVRVSGRNLVIDLPDGTQMLIVDGAVFVPRLVIGDVEVPATNLAALLIDSEIRPAAGAPQSGGGNFEVPVGPLDPGVDLGDLIPPTELNYVPPLFEEGAFDVDSEPTILIQTPDQPLGADNATASVNEHALPARNGEPAGSNSASTAESTTGTITYESLDEPNTITIRGVEVVSVGQKIAGTYGDLTISSIANGEIGYSYTLRDNTAGDTTSDVFSVVITDNDGDTDSATLTIAIIDDVPVAVDDTDVIASGAFGPAAGNVITDAEGDGGRDTVGADNAFVVGVAVGNTNANLDSAGTLGTLLQGSYGKLTLGTDGGYTYTRDPGTPGGVNDVFTYTLKDGDGDLANATLTVAIGDGGVTTTIPAAGGATTTVYEAALATRNGGEPAGTAEAADGNSTDNDDGREAVSGTIGFSAIDGLGSISLAGTTLNLSGSYPQTVSSNATGSLVVTGVSFNPATGAGSIAYTYTLIDNSLTDPSSVSFALIVTDRDAAGGGTADSSSGTLTIAIIDDAPVAMDDSNSVDEGGIVGGSVLPNDVPGADGYAGAVVGGVLGSNDGVDTINMVGGSITLVGTYGSLTLNADGSYSYDGTANSNPPSGAVDQFVYTIRDGDGDLDSATLTINLRDIDIALSDDEALVFENALPVTGSTPLSNGETFNGQIVATGSAGSYTYALTSPANGTYGTLTLNPDGSYSFVLDTPFDTSPDADNGVTTETGESFSYTVTDPNGNSSNGTIVVSIVDDVPTLTVDGPTTVVEGATVNGTYTQTIGADQPGAVTVVVFGGTEFALGTPIATGLGTLTVLADGSWTFTANNNLNNNVAQSIGFTIKVTDADGDSDEEPHTVEITDGAPPTGGAVLGLEVDDDALSDGSNAASTDEIDSGTLSFTAGSDALTSFAFAAGTGTLGGGLSWTRVSDTLIEGRDGGTLILSLALTAPASIAAGASGTVTVTATLADNYDSHPTINVDDLLALGAVTVVAADQDGDSATGTVNLSVSDDVPTLTIDGPTTVVEGATVNGTYTQTIGADQPGAVTVVVFGGTDYALGTPIATGLGTLTVNADGTWTFTANNNLDNNVVQSIGFTIKVTDADGDSDEEPHTVEITDGAPPTGGAVLGLEVDDDALSDGSNAASTDEMASGTLGFTAGSDALTSFAFAAGTGTLGGGLSWTRVSDVLIEGRDGGTLILSLALTAPASIAAGASGTVTVTATLADNYDSHPTINVDDLLALGAVTVVAADQDGDSATGTVNLSVSDDVPTLTVDGPTTVVEGATVNGTYTQTIGADQPGAVTVVVFGGTEFALGTPIATGLGTLTVNAGGTWMFVANNNVNNSVAQSIGFTIKVTDADGDIAQDPHSVAITDGAPPVGGEKRFLRVDDDALIDGTNAASNGEVDADTISFTAGSDALTSFAFAAGTGSLGGGLSWTRVSDVLIEGRDGGTLILSLALTAPASIAAGASGTVTVTATLANNYDSHPTINVDDIMQLGVVTVVAADQDGDSATGTFNLAVSDDVPTLTVDGPTTVVEGATVNGTYTQTIGADQPGAVTVVVFGGTDYALGTPIATGLGTLTVNAADATGAGTWTFVANNLNQGVAQSISFTIKVTDADGDSDEEPHTVEITDGAPPTGGAVLGLEVDDDALSDGSNAASTDEMASGTLGFTAGSDALTSFAFAAGTGTLGGGLSWTRVSDVLIEGRDGGTLILSLALTAPASIAAGASGTVTVTATLADNYDSHPTINVDDLLALGSVTVVAADQDGDSATGTVNLSVSDDVPTLTVDGPTTVVEGATVNGTYTQTIGADQPGAVTVVVFGGTDYALGTPIATGLGTLTVLADGTWTFTANNNLNNNVAQSIGFTIKVTDADGDSDEEPHTVEITDGAPPTGGAVLGLEVDDDALSDGSNAASTDEMASGTLSFTAGSDALTSFAFAAGTGTLGGGLSWTRVSDTLIEGRDGGTLILSLALTAPASIAAGASGTVTVTATLADNYDSHPTINVDDLLALGAVTVVAADQDGDSATGTVNLSVSDDVPEANNDPLVTVAEDGANVGGNVMTNDLLGADGSILTHINLGAGFVAITTGVNLGGGVYQFTEAGVGVYTFNSAGIWTFDPALNQSNNITPVDAGFSYRITDGDNDTAEAVQPINVTDGAIPGTGGTVALSLVEAALDTTQGGADLAAGSVNGTTPGSTAETQVVAAASGLHFSAGSDAITSVAFSLASAPVVAGLQTGYSVSWAINGTGQLVGSLIGPGSVNLGTAIIVQLTGATGTTAAGGTADVGVTATLVGPLEHAYPSAVQGPVEISAIQVRAAQADGDFGSGTVSISVSDDTPTAFAPIAASTTNNAAGLFTGTLDTPDSTLADNYGADGGTAKFIAAGLPTTLKSAGVALSYTISSDGQTLTATQGVSGATVFTATISGSSYTIDIVRPIDSVTTVDFLSGNYDHPGGNPDYYAFYDSGNNNSPDLLLTPAGGGTSVNLNSNLFGIGAGNSMDPGDAVRLDFVTDFESTGNSVGAWTFDGHYITNGATVGIAKADAATARFTAFDDADGNSTVGDGVADAITQVSIKFGLSTTLITPTSTYSSHVVGGQTFWVILNPDNSVSVGGLQGDANGGVQTTVGIFTASGYNSLVVAYEAGSHGTDTFKIGGFGAAVPNTDPVDFNIPVQIVDGDGDLGPAANIAVHLTTPPLPVVLDTNHDGVISYLGVDAGVAYDYDGDGEAEATAWIGRGDSLLVRDADGNGTVSNASEFVFGGNGQTDLEALHAQYGAQLDASDADFVQFMVWNDANSNGVAEVGELQSLTDARIVSIGLVSDGIASSAAGGDVSIAGEGQFTYVNDNGQTAAGLLADVGFRTADRETDLAQRLAGAANSAGVVTAAIAAMGLAASQAAANVPDAAPRGVEAVVQSGQASGNAADAASAGAGTVDASRPLLGNESRVAADDDQAANGHVANDAAPVDAKLVDPAQEADAPTSLLGSSEPAVHDSVATSPVEPMIVMPSADSLVAMSGASEAGGTQRAITVEKILAEALHGGTSGDDIDTLLAGLPNNGSGDNPALAALASPQSEGVSAWDTGASGSLSDTLMTNIVADMTVFHHDAVQPAING